MIIAPARGGFLVGATWKGQGLVEAEAGYVGGLDDVGVVVAFFGEGDGEVLDLMFDSEFHQELDEVPEVFDEVVVAFVGFDVAQEDYVVGEIEYAFGLRQDDKCSRKCRVVRGQADAISVLFIGQSGGGSSEIVGEIFLYIGERISQILVGFLSYLYCRFRFFFVVLLWAAAMMSANRH